MRCDRAKNGKGGRGSSCVLVVQAQCSAFTSLKGLLNLFPFLDLRLGIIPVN